MSNPFQAPDPNRDHESQRYSCPIVSREHILACLRAKGCSLSLRHLIKSFDYQENEVASQALEKRLMAMVRDGQLYRDDEGHFAIISDHQSLEGQVLITRDGKGYAILEGHDDRIPIPRGVLKRLFHGDVVQVRRYRRHRRGPWRYAVQMPAQVSPRVLMGQYHEHHGEGYVRPVGRDTDRWIFLSAKNNADHYQIGDWLSVQVEAYDLDRRVLVGHVIKPSDQKNKPMIQDWQAGITSLLVNEQVDTTWSDAVLSEAVHLPDQPAMDDRRGRRDYSQLPFVTIDGEDAKDFDDAIYAESLPQSGGWRLWVAIADVSHYVCPGTALDEVARLRSTSIYLPDRVVPMLPEALSNGLCSLRPNEDRLAMVAVIDVSPDGHSQLVEFVKAVIRSHHRLTYDQVQAMMQDEQSVPENWAASFESLVALSQVLWQQRKARQAIPFVTPEWRVCLGSHMQIMGFNETYTHDAHALIEACMLLANEHAARWCDRQGLPVLYRVHRKPDRIAMAQLAKQFGRLGVRAHYRHEQAHRCIGQWLKVISDRLDFSSLQLQLLQSMPPAEYKVRNEGHFSLALEDYAHFTSPIRRYPDLWLHRQMSQVLSGQAIATDTAETCRELAGHCTRQEKRADQLSRMAMSALQCCYLKPQEGRELSGVVVAIKNYGCFVRLQDSGAEGLLSTRDMLGDDYSYHEAGLCLRGRRSGHTLNLGDQITVMLARVDENRQFINFSWTG